jgi:hypothetical protein
MRKNAMMSDPTQRPQPSSDLILRRIDAIIQELQELCQVVLVQRPSSEAKLAEQLYSALGQGSWDEYDPDLDWPRVRRT